MNGLQRVFVLWGILRLLTAGVVLAAADGGKPEREPRKAKVPVYTLEREAAALTFVKQHNAELAKLVTSLKKPNLDEYKRAIHDLFRASERLTGLREKQPRRYDLELRRWKINSRLQILTARAQMGDHSAVEKKLRKALLEAADVKTDLLLEERDRYAARVKQIDTAIGKLRADRDRRIERRLQALLSSSGTKKNPRTENTTKTTDAKTIRRATKETE